MFADIDADVYVMVDGDATYDPRCAHGMVRLLLAENLDMVVAARVASENSAFRQGHRFGNILLTKSVGHLFGNRFTDMLSGYRAFSRRFVKSFPAMSSGFETETELTIHALELSLPVAEIASPYGGRVEGSVSKLNTFSDGLKILRLILVLYKNERPLKFFSTIAGILGLSALGLGIPLVITFLRTGLVFRQPTALLATGLVLLAALSLVTGLILDTCHPGPPGNQAAGLSGNQGTFESPRAIRSWQRESAAPWLPRDTSSAVSIRSRRRGWPTAPGSQHGTLSPGAAGAR